MFASNTIAAHIVRGVIAAALIAWALLHQSSNPAFAVAAGVVAVAAMRGCPLCWTVGLVETCFRGARGSQPGVAARLRGAPSSAKPATAPDVPRHES
ncbi:MAG: hypothetical protein DMF95_27955 [Acidobacteria bacterium]|nr:MAG: hypothetical protein DMF94_11490 [Acidobacteriota bacterium]PYR42592.1 MAG: hypothetical protein DMF95_27955 [Acidobacteriota bacterium]